MDSHSISDHFDGYYFYNPHHKEEDKKGFLDYFIWSISNPLQPWNEREIIQRKISQERVLSGETSVTFINHSTVLIQIDGINILTDPIWSERASPVSWAGPKRVVAPGVKFEDLPPIDIVLVSHNHYDHLDLTTLKKLEKAFHPRFFVPKKNKSFLQSEGLKNVVEMDWWDEVPLTKDLSLTFVPSQHFSARSLFDRNKTLWGGFVIESPSQLIYFAGDTAYSPHFKEIKERLGKPTLALLPIGAFQPRWLMKGVHMSPQDAVQAHLDLEAVQSMAIHFGTFQMSADEYDEPTETLKKTLEEQKIDLEDFWILEQGESRQVFKSSLTDPS